MWKSLISEAFSKINYFKGDSEISRKRNAESMTEVDENEYIPVPKRLRKSIFQKEAANNQGTTSGIKHKFFTLPALPTFMSHIVGVFGRKASVSTMPTCDTVESDKNLKKRGWRVADSTCPTFKSSILAREPLHTNQSKLRNPFKPVTSQIPVILVEDDADDIDEKDVYPRGNHFKPKTKSPEIFDVEDENWSPRNVRRPKKKHFASLNSSRMISPKIRKTPKKKHPDWAKSSKFNPFIDPASLESYRIDDKETYTMLLKQNCKPSSYASLYEADKKIIQQRDACIQTLNPRRTAFYKENLTDTDKIRNMKREIEQRRIQTIRSQSASTFSQTPWETKLIKNSHVFTKPVTPVSRVPVATNFAVRHESKFSTLRLEEPEVYASLRKCKSVESLKGKASQFSNISQGLQLIPSPISPEPFAISGTVKSSSNISSYSTLLKRNKSVNNIYFGETWLNSLKRDLEKCKKKNEENVRDETLQYEATQIKKQVTLFETNRKRLESLSSKFSTVTVEDEDEEETDKMPLLTSEMEVAIDSAFQPNPPSEVLTQGFGINIMRKDIETLAGLNWLNDEIINFYTNLLMERGKLNNFPSCYAFNTFFYPKLMSSGHGALKRWTRKVDVFAYDLILIPVHLGMHWCLAVIDFRSKKIQYYDSMGGQNNDCLNALRRYLHDERKDKKKEDFDTSDWKLEAVKNIPQQMNGSDCGMFACKYAEYITRNARITFTQAHMPYFRRRMVYEITTKKLL